MENEYLKRNRKEKWIFLVKRRQGDISAKRKNILRGEEEKC